MNFKIKIIIVFLTIIIGTFVCYLFFKQNQDEQDIVSILKLPIKKEQIMKMESQIQSDNSIDLKLIIEHDFCVENFSAPFNIGQYKGSRLYDELAALIKENNMSIEETTIHVYHVTHSIKKGFFSEVQIPRPVYIIIGNSNNTIIYTNIPEGVTLPQIKQ